ncbi:hypothetical protein CDD82_4529 [Ophiocordyceps australis]|uniref:Transmembrane protein 19 n=1 Tax=Ophiocordyceps australis TaxID=1399860 RepID=A0A2C5XK61_9HYPO|nr:hypothetical protein CDD82_4529 [Ophiocordyceps australis]
MKTAVSIPAVALLVGYAWKKKSLTPLGLVAGALTGLVHAWHPWNLSFVLLLVFFLAGSRATRVKENVKAHLTTHSRGSSGPEGPRTQVQVLANSLMGSILTILHAIQLRRRAAAYADTDSPDPHGTMCFSWGGDLLVIGIIANYACVTADTFSSELGILSRSEPRLITSPTLRKVPRGTNGGVTLLGLAAGMLGSLIVVTAAMLSLPVCTQETSHSLGGGIAWSLGQRRELMAFLVMWGTLGSVLDSVLGALFQRSVRDIRSGKIVEGEGGCRVLVSASTDTMVGGSVRRAEAMTAALGGHGGSTAAQKLNTCAIDEHQEETEGRSLPEKRHRRSSFGDERPSRVVESGWDLLDNNDVNFLMACMMSVGAMAVASWYWAIPLESLMRL